jgi:hypothetical protein
MGNKGTNCRGGENRRGDSDEYDQSVLCTYIKCCNETHFVQLPYAIKYSKINNQNQCFRSSSVNQVVKM